jgi:hypothetical protein
VKDESLMLFIYLLNRYKRIQEYKTNQWLSCTKRRDVLTKGRLVVDDGNGMDGVYLRKSSWVLDRGPH